MTANVEPYAQRVHELLGQNGYTRLPPSMTIGDITLEVHDAWDGPPGTLDLAMVASRPQSRVASSQLYWAVQRLVRALESAESQRTITVILIGEVETTSAEVRRSELELQTLGRVLVVEGNLPVDRALAPLIVLDLPPVGKRELDGVGMVEQSVLGRRRESDLTALLTAAKDGPRAVEAWYMAWVDQAFSPKAGAHDA